MFVSSLELIAHATELYAQKHDKKYKFVILHLANAIELIFKDCLIDKGVSIYKPGTNQTIGVWEAFKDLEKHKVDIKERPIIELLIDDRNTIQHRFGYPNAESVYYYLEHVIAFFKRFLEEQYGLNLAETLEPHLTKELLQLLGLVKDENNVKDEFAHLDAIMKISPEAAVTEAYKYLEKEIASDISRIYGSYIGTTRVVRPQSIMQNFGIIARDLEENGYLNPGESKEFEDLRRIRNTAAHVVSDPSDPVWSKTLDTAKKFIKAIRKAKDDGFFTRERTPKI